MLKILEGEALNIIKTFPSNYIDCVITSPPYWRLRDYKHKDETPILLKTIVTIACFMI